MTANQNLCWAIVPAAGIGSRMQQKKPKQYLDLNGQPILSHTLTQLLQFPFQKIIVAVASDDSWFDQLPVIQDSRIIKVEGGAERYQSVANGLNWLAACAAERDWVMVHDAARPCIRLAEINKLYQQLIEHPVGGLLGVPVKDTLKAVSEQGEVEQTVPRENLWQAQTPQMFRFGLLRRALAEALMKNQLVTDEASAVEQLGYSPLMVEGREDNLKVTRPVDLPLAAFCLEHQTVEG
ncbi:2-C-methyl-D-erythritol 4-phosphate cytidylyltransferase [Endozoicomonas sp. SM1973]|uniref:2-C-methyl-D-erythritol 4-phosphate cytidylyltransferase n=1 Tax=Spartinivicinus marinus TaxID=2994442 RepID=A0A853HU96_9GAMM|nr:2-C-methyl-D-erythritol 4-phosphate cytidylyltransferase [Spartinivicinus marinus]MCX4025431.1 2-C-methyl-D-erythritol 4-phosphate cytidylyltransferase [Spartinivicinus marinus]NYZ65340.1 2-C-methyl-D-erythritol 4-phosphate cytidylyltransferase [Spartinivicinus marinus]